MFKQQSCASDMRCPRCDHKQHYTHVVEIRIYSENSYTVFDRFESNKLDYIKDVEKRFYKDAPGYKGETIDFVDIGGFWSCSNC